MQCRCRSSTAPFHGVGHLGVERAAVRRLASELGVDALRHVIGHLLEAAEGAGTRRGDALLGLGDLPADSLVELGETGSRGGAVRLLTLARQAAGILARIG